MHLQIALGNSPLILFRFKFNDRRKTSLETPAGILPERLLLERSTISRLVDSVKDFGISPLSLFDERLRTLSQSISDSVGGMVPVKLLSGKEISITLPSLVLMPYHYNQDSIINCNRIKIIKDEEYIDEIVGASQKI